MCGRRLLKDANLGHRRRDADPPLRIRWPQRLTRTDTRGIQLGVKPPDSVFKPSPPLGRFRGWWRQPSWRRQCVWLSSMAMALRGLLRPPAAAGAKDPNANTNYDSNENNQTRMAIALNVDVGDRRLISFGHRRLDEACDSGRDLNRCVGRRRRRRARPPHKEVVPWRRRRRPRSQRRRQLWRRRGLGRIGRRRRWRRGRGWRW